MSSADSGVNVMNTITVSSSTELMAALATGTAGTTILLGSGNYGDLNLSSASQPWSQFAGEMTIKSADAAHPATFSSVSLTGVQNLTFDGVKFDYVAAAGGVDWVRGVAITGSDHISIKNSKFDGDLAHGVGETLDGYGSGFGLYVERSSNVTIENNEFFNWGRAGVFTGVDNFIVKGNDVHDIRSDGFDFANVNNVLIEDNYIHDFRTAPGSGDHPDMIQFWTAGTSSPSTNIMISDNFLDSGAGQWTQSIFMDNELIDQGIAGQEMYYKNVTIENNVIYNAHIHGITVGETIGLTINNNTILQNPASAPDAADLLWVPSIHIKDASQNVLIANNILPQTYNPQLTTPTDQRTLEGNIWVQSNDPHAANYVGDLFVNALAGAHATLADLKAVPGGIIDQTNVGASLTHAVGDYTVTLETGANSVAFDSGANTVDAVIGTGATLHAGDTLAGGSGIDTLNLSGAGSFDLKTIALTGFEQLNLSANETVTLNNENLSVHGAGNNAVTLGTGTDGVSFDGGTNIVNAVIGTGATLWYGDSLVGGTGMDTLNLTGAGAIDLNKFALTGFENLNLAAGETVTLNNAQFTVHGVGNDVVTLGTGPNSVSFDGGTNIVNAAIGTGATLGTGDSLVGVPGPGHAEPDRRWRHRSQQIRPHGLREFEPRRRRDRHPQQCTIHRSRRRQ